MTCRRPASAPPLGAVVMALALVGACSRGDGTDIDARGPSETIVTTTTVAPTGVATDASGATDAFVTQPAEATGDSADEPTDDMTGDETIAFDPTATAPPVSEVPETGVPGLDSDDAFCAAWSRFGGSFQVVAVNAAFGAGSIEDRAFIEVAAGPTVVAAHSEMDTGWPDAIAAEQEVAIDDLFGPLARRLEAAVDALTDAGLTPELGAALDDAWIGFLTERDPTDAEVVLVLDDELSAIVEAAVPAYLEAVGPWADDESLITDTATPLTDAYLASACPDQGTLAGQEVGQEVG